MSFLGPRGVDTRDARSGRRTAGLCLVIGLLVASGIPLAAGDSASSAGTPTATPGTSVSSLPATLPADTVTVTDHQVSNLSDFWGVGVNPPASLPNETPEVTGTPITWYEWPASQLADYYNMTTGQMWWYGHPYAYGSNESQFVQWCESIACHAILALPGETDNLSTVLWDVHYTEDVLHFQPAYWEIGCEPYSWTHFGISWQNWKTTDDIRVNATSYAEVVHSFIPPMKALDPTAKFLGLPGVGAGTRPDSPWINATVELNGPNISAISIHDYPAEMGPANADVAQFMQTLLGDTSITTRVATDELAVKAACPNCTHKIRFFVDEFGSGTSSTGGWQPFMQTYPEVPYVAAELIMMMQSNVSNADLYDLNSVYNGSLFSLGGTARPLDSLYTQILSHFDPELLASNLSGGVSGVFASVSESVPDHSLSLLAVNTNTTQSVNLDVAGNGFPSDGSYSTWRANNSATSSNGTFQTSAGYGATSSWVLPPLGVLLVSVCLPGRSTGAPDHNEITFCETGLPTGTRWSVTIDGHTVYRKDSTVPFQLPNGTYKFEINPVTGWHASIVSGTLTVSGASASVRVAWTSQPTSIRHSQRAPRRSRARRAGPPVRE